MLTYKNFIFCNWKISQRFLALFQNTHFTHLVYSWFFISIHINQYKWFWCEDNRKQPFLSQKAAELSLCWQRTAYLHGNLIWRHGEGSASLSDDVGLSDNSLVILNRAAPLLTTADLSPWQARHLTSWRRTVYLMTSEFWQWYAGAGPLLILADSSPWQHYLT